MYLSKTKIGVFFLAVLVLGWLLYPRELFLGFIYEGFTEFHRSEQFYQKYLQDHPKNKFATLRLASLYERMGEADKAALLLKGLRDHRRKDWEVTERYLDHLENSHEEEELYHARLEAVRDFEMVPGFPSGKVEDLLYGAYQYASWKQRDDESYSLLQQLVRLSRKPEFYLWNIQDLDRAFHQTDRVVQTLEDKLKRNPRDLPSRLELISVYQVVGESKKATELISEGLQHFPQNLSLLKVREELYRRGGEIQERIENLEVILGSQEMTREEKIDYRIILGELQEKRGEFRVADKIYDETILLLRQYLKEFPEVIERQRQLVELLLYHKKDTTALDLYSDFIRMDRQASYLVDVANLLEQSGQKRESVVWLKRHLPLFSGDFKIVRLLLDGYSDQKDYEEALEIGLSFVDDHPDDAEAHLEVALLYSRLGDGRSASHFFTRVENLGKGNARLLLKAGRELYFFGEYDRAEDFLKKVVTLLENSPEPWFWLFEISYVKGEDRKARQRARLVLQRVSSGNPDSRLIRMGLKVQAFLGFDEKVSRAYQMAIKKYPRDEDLHSDYLGLLIEDRRYEEARVEITEIRLASKKPPEWIKPHEIQLAYAVEDWGMVIPLLEKVRYEKPGEMFYRRDLAEAYVRSGSWEKGIREYEQVREETGNRLGAVDALRELHKEYDIHAGAAFQLVDYGADESLKWGVSSRFFLSRDWQLEGEGFAGRYRSPGLGFSSIVEEGRLSLSKYFRPDWKLTGGVGFGTSDLRTVVMPLAHLTYHPSHRFKTSIGYELRQLRTDVPQAVAAGALRDVGSFQYEIRPWERVLLTGDYHFGRNVLSDGSRAEEQRLEPGVSFILSQRPYLTIGYLFRFLDLTAHNDFDTQVPLIPRIEAHYLTGYLEHRIHPQFSVEGGFFAGEDFERTLHLFKGDLWGAQGGIEWNILSWIDLIASYSFGRETLTGLPGNSHQGRFVLSGHWF
ncbi:MAG: tetratricopeptide repeat protein [Deltaproteobacteria bacterium]|nr:tetratricopeptide repeat protein [Deltaproteobacteria bacterium]